MHQFLESRKFAPTTLAALVVYAAGLLLIWIAYPSIAAENALMENLQAGCLAIACILMVPCLIRPAAKTGRVACWCLFLLFLAMFLREVDVESLPVPSAVVWIGSGIGRNLLLGSAFVATFVVMAVRPNESIGQVFQYTFSRVGALLFVGGVFYVCSIPFDNNLLGLSFELNQFCEEAVECCATVLFLTAAGFNLVQHLVALRSNPAQQPTPIPTARIAA